MPPPGGPLIGSGMKEMIAEAAILADMEHRDFISHGDGLFKKTLTAGGGEYIDAWQVEVRDGSVVIDQIMDQGSTPSGDAPTPEDYAYLQQDVFVYWKSAIDDAFRYWEDFPESDGLGYDLSSVLSGSSEIRLRTTTDSDTGESEAGNSRLSSDITNLGSRTGELNGDYAEAFHENYTSRLRDNVDALHALTMVLAYALGGEKELFARTREQIADVALQAKAAMEASAPRSGDGSTALTIGLIVVGAVASGVAAVASGGTSIPATVAVISGFTSAGASAAGDLLGALSEPEAAPEDLPLGADDPHGVLTNLVAALGEIDTRIQREEEALQELLVATLGETAGYGPFNIEATSTPPGSSVLEREQDLVVDAGMIAKITQLWIPTINGDLNACASKLDTTATAWKRPIILGLGPEGPWQAYSDLQDQVAALLRDTAAELTGAGESLQEAARIIGLSDEATNQQFASQAQQINRDNVNY